MIIARILGAVEVGAMVEIAVEIDAAVVAAVAVVAEIDAAAAAVEIDVAAAAVVGHRHRYPGNGSKENIMAKLRVKYVRSSIGYPQDQKDTIRALGLRKLQHTVEHDDNPAVRGMIRKVIHLVQVEEVIHETV